MNFIRRLLKNNQVKQAPPVPTPDIAVVGISCRFPDAPDYATFFSNLQQGKNAIREIPRSRWDIEKYYSPEAGAVNKSISKWCGLLDDVTGFDNRFFGISPREAALMDPQQRLLLQEAVHCIEDAAIPMARLRALQTAVFIGVMTIDYMNEVAGPQVETEGYSTLGNYECMLANRLSHFLGFRGKSLAIDNACASSLVALHEAKASLQRGEADYALVGGVNLCLHPWKYISFSKARMLSPDGQCKTFDKDANGYVPGEGIGLVLLQRLDDAVASGNHIYGVIKGSAVNHVGRTASVTAPSVAAQEQLILTACKDAGISAETITYVEAHGTGTSLGDPIEVEALSRAFRTLTDRKQFCHIGAVKTNIGHLEAAAGVAGLIKVLMMMKHAQIVPTCNIGELNPLIDFDRSPFIVAKQVADWKRNGAPLRAGISSFGMGGANAHVIVEEYRQHTPAQYPDKVFPFLLSAKSKESLLSIAEKWKHVAVPSLADSSASLATGREHYPWRLGGVVNHHTDIPQLLMNARTAAHKPGSCALLTGQLQAEGFQAVAVLWERLELFRQTVHTLSMLAGSPRLGKKLYAGFQQGLWERVYIPLYRFMTGYAVCQCLKQAGLPVDLISAGEGEGALLLAAVCAEVIPVENAVTALLQPGPLDTLSGRRPVIPFYDAAVEQFVYPFRLSAGYLPGLLQHLTASPAILAAYAGKARVLLQGQHTFIRLTDEWEPLLAARGLSVKDLLKKEETGSNSSREGRLLLLLLLYTFYRLFAKWDLQDKIPDDHWYTMICLLRDRMLNKEQTVSLLLDDQPAFEEIRQELEARLNEPGKKSYGGLLQPDTADVVLNNARTVTRQLPEGFQWISVGSPGSRKGAIREVTLDMENWVSVLTSLWTDGYDINWNHLYPQGTFGKVPLPGYAFIPEQFWVNKTLSPEPVAPEQAKNILYACQEWRHQPLTTVGGSYPLTWALAEGQDYRPVSGDVIRLTAQHYYPASADIPSGLVYMPAVGAAVYPAEQVRLFLIFLQSLAARPLKALLPVFFVYRMQDDNGTAGYDALMACGSSLLLEQKDVQVNIIGIAAGIDDASLVRVLQQEIHHGSKNPRLVHYRKDGQRYSYGWREVQAAQGHHHFDQQIRDNGVYLITGGAGQLGWELAIRLVQRTGVHVIICGRSAKDITGHANIHYIQADVADEIATAALVDAIRKRYGMLNGIFHCAGILRDSMFRQKSIASFGEVAAVKVKGAIHLDEYTKHDQLDFFLLYSSVVAVTGNYGQTDYAYANSFLTHFAAWRNRRLAAGERSGNSYALLWPLMETGGMKITQGAVSVLDPGNGFEAASGEDARLFLDQLFTLRQDALLCVKGDLERLRSWIDPPQQVTVDAVLPVSEDLYLAAVLLVRNIFGDLLHVNPLSLEDDSRFQELGVDSIIINHFNDKLEALLGSVSKTLLFEHSSLQELAAHLSKAYASQLRHHQQRELPAETVSVPAAIVIEKHEEVTKPRTLTEEAGQVQDIAIIGLHGRYPGAASLEQFWENLRSGRESVTEIPGERWDYRVHYREGVAAFNNGDVYAKWGAFLKDVDKFDPLFFSVSPREAALMDPQERIFIETVWHTLEDAQYPPARIAALRNERASCNVGVFAGITTYTYNLLGPVEWEKGNPEIPNALPWTLANRISYLFDLKGPSMPVDTACASSLTAIHLACRSLRQGECEMAIAGAVNLYLHPSKYAWLCQMKMLSPRGQCSAFGQDADGFVPGEGAGAVLLKPLAAALRDNDKIYGVIKGTAVNHGGRTNGFTVPNPNAQADLIAAAIKEAGIPIASISYIEAHGTGTALGDPVEMSGLLKAFQGHPGGCAVGSVKSNIGHLEAAAGMAGLTKVLLQLKHRQLAPSLHTAVLNPKLDLTGTPFRIQQHAGEWDVLPSSYPRRAGISAFGAGGANAHIIVEEYTAPPAEVPVVVNTPQLIVISAKDKEGLERYHALLRTQLERLHETADFSLADWAWSLQTGREPLEERLAYVAENAGDLLQQMKAYPVESINRRENNIRSGKTRKRLEQEGTATDQESILQHCRERNLHLLATLWVSGVAVPWEALHAPSRHPQSRRIDLPLYPFAAESYWFGELPAEKLQQEKVAAGHPFHITVEKSEATSYTCKAVLEDKAFYLDDHYVGEDRIFPAVGYIEMARAAFELAAGVKVASVKNNVWPASIVSVTDTTTVLIDFTKVKNGWDYKVSSQLSHDRITIHGQGKIIPADQQPASAGATAFDINSIAGRCQKTIDGAVFYPRLYNLGLRLGKSFQAVRQARFGEEEALSVLELPAHLQTDYHRYNLHPAMMDSALQTALRLLDNRRELQQLNIPFTIGEIEILDAIPSRCYAYVHADKTAAAGKVNKYQVHIINGEGRLLVRIKDFVLRPYELPGKEKATGYFYQPVWQPASLQLQAASLPAGTVLLFDTDEQLYTHYRQQLRAGTSLVLIKPGNAFRELAPEVYEINPLNMADYLQLLKQLVNPSPSITVLHYWSKFRGDHETLQAGLDHPFLERGCYAVLYLLQAFMPQYKQLALFYVYEEDAAGIDYYSPVSGLLRSAALEYSDARFCTIGITAGSAAVAKLPEILTNEIQSFPGKIRQVRYDKDERFLLFTSPVSLTPPALRAQHKGVILITGGAGGLGQIFARYFAQYPDVTVVLTGRRPVPENLLKENIRYHACDITQPAAVQEMVARIHTEYGAVTGLIHAAGVLADAFIANKTLAQIRSVLAPKLLGLQYLDKALKDSPLSFCMLFSSTAAVMGSAGQADYGYANAFMDTYALYRERLRTKGLRQGRTVSVNWPLWKEGGMQVHEETLAWMQSFMGITPISTASGISVLETALGAAIPQLMYAEGNAERITQLLNREDQPKKTVTVAASVPVTSTDWHGALQQILRETAAGIQKMEPGRLHVNYDLTGYGFDSVAFTKLSNSINHLFGIDITPAVFFEYPDIASLGAYLRESFAEDLSAYFRPAATVAAPLAVAAFPGTVAAGIPDQLQAAVIACVADIAKMSAERINPKYDLSNYGLDSIAFTRLANQLNQYYQVEITPAIFFEYSTAASLSQHLLDEYTEEVMTVHGKVVEAKPTAVVQENITTAAMPPVTNLQEPVAIIGMAGVLPQSENLAVFWEHLLNGDDLVTEIPADRWNWREYDGDPAKEENKTDSRWGGFIPDIDKFDAKFFGISPREAALMDPQQRVFLQVVYHALEDAGYKPSQLHDYRTGLYVGVATHDYYELLKNSHIPVEAYTTTGMFHAILANRVSYLLNLTGPSFPIDTACSGSLVAIRSAIEAIRCGSCDMAVAGGVNFLLSPTIYISFAKAGMLSPDGRCKTFDASANGYVRGEGAGAVILKSLSRAEADGDHIYAVIRGSAVNHGGRVNTMTAPNPNAQAELIMRAMEEAKVDPATITYVEAHGTGTSLGDPIEINGLKKAFRELARKSGKALPENYCGIGSVKTNIGHLESGAGIAGLFKLLLGMKHGLLPATIHQKEQNPYIQLEHTPFYIVREKQDWKRLRDASGNEIPRRAALSSFGFGGVNAHLVVEEYIPAQKSGSMLPQLVVLSAGSEAALKQYVTDFITWLKPSASGASGNSETADQLRASVAAYLHVSPEDIDLYQPLSEYGLDGVHQLKLGELIADTFNRNIPTHELSALTCLAEVLDLAGPGPEVATVAALDRIAFTLHHGREEMAVRLAIVAADTTALLQSFRRFLDGEKHSPVLSFAILDEDETREDISQLVIKASLEARDLHSLAKYWLSGAAINWSYLYPDTNPGRIALPVYPFEKQRHWAPVASPVVKETPVLKQRLCGKQHVAVSNDQVVVFEYVFKAEDTLIKEHQVNNECLLPGAAYLEMLCGAMAILHPDRVFSITRVVWLSPLVMKEQEIMAFTRMEKQKDGYCCRISSGEHTQHFIAYTHFTDSRELPVEEHWKGLQQQASVVLPGEKIYDVFAKNTFEYGESFRSINTVWIGNGEALALAAPVAKALRASSFELSPYLMDAALQCMSLTSARFITGEELLKLPFSVEKITLFAPLSDVMYIHVKKKGEQVFDVVLRSEKGIVAAVLEDVSIRGWKSGSDLRFYEPYWQAAALVAEKKAAYSSGVLIVYVGQTMGLEKEVGRMYAEGSVKYLQLCHPAEPRMNGALMVDPADGELLRACIAGAGAADTVYFINGPLSATGAVSSSSQLLEHVYHHTIIALFRLIKIWNDLDRLQSMTAFKVVDVNLLSSGGPLGVPFGAMLHGFTKSMAKEYRHIALSNISVEIHPAAPLGNIREVAKALFREPGHPEGNEVKLTPTARYEQLLRPVTPQGSDKPPYREKGVYLLAGGGGGIGMAFSRYLAQTVQARLVWLGRSVQLTAEQEETVAEIRRMGGDVLYLSTDITDESSINTSVSRAIAHFGRINGVVHTALSLRDNIIDLMEEESLRRVLDPKVKGGYLLGKCFMTEPLDFFLFFSSAQSYTGSMGQSNYAAASTFEDAYARWLGAQTAYPVKVINWGYWGSVGVVSGAYYRKQLELQGIFPIGTREGITTIGRILGSALPQVLAIKAEKTVLEKMGCREPETVAAGGIKDAVRYVEKMGRLLLWKSLREMGLFVQQETLYEINGWFTRSGIRPVYRQPLTAWLLILEKAGLIKIKNGVAAIRRELNVAAIEQEVAKLESIRQQIAARYPVVRDTLYTVWECLTNLQHILSGNTPVKPILGAGRQLRAAQIEIQAAERIKDLLYQQEESWQSESARILDLGGDNGIFPQQLLQKLQMLPFRVEYVYTGTTEQQLRELQDRYGAAYPFARFVQLLPDEDPGSQGFTAGYYDLIICTQVLHSTRYIRQSLEYMRQLLKPGGCIVITETVTVREFHYYTDALEEAWWRNEDKEHRIGNSALLSAAGWEKILEQSGFHHIRIPGADGLLHQVITAISLTEVVIAANGGSISIIAQNG
ncbi:MAG TPA: SDR family NAD(P)-dependent oxidoreductase [Chitinophaga sp.]|uniref:SDR family NAD(P)-dependent oxidoreductase n=1 Tax=Chitinophaga sp. TaxID=1869181 RepID=UPI002C5D1458|nr:SDR family NAD(P)-dependent oxidoreductase [Chitinophaga sp.]HVI45850.1 SDR family NAD(P)-dependent oxidoreductase [Chitinophaga sp.]